MGSTKGPILKTALLLLSVVIASLGVRQSKFNNSIIQNCYGSHDPFSNQIVQVKYAHVVPVFGH